MTHETELLDDITDLLKGYDAVRDGAEDSIARDIVSLIGNRVRPPDELDFLGDHITDLETGLAELAKSTAEMGDTLNELMSGIPGLEP